MLLFVICIGSLAWMHLAVRMHERAKSPTQTEDEALEVIVALTQMYREHARYLERIYKWAKRVGTNEIRRQVLDDRGRRRSYFERFVQSQTFAQVDPWSERVSGLHKHEFRPLAAVGLRQAAE